MLHKIIKGVAPLAAMVVALGVSACDGHISINGKSGVPLAELDTKGKTPTEVVLAGPDNVVVTDGDALTIEVSGDAKATDAVRFTIDDDALGIMREKNSGDKLGKATVHVTLPRLTKLTLAGSGTIDAQNLVGDAEVTVAGSGSVKTAKVTAGSLDVTIAGSGSYTAAGTAKSLDLSVAGSGNSKMAGLKVDSADVTVAGSGSASFASDGKVDASIMGSGDVTVTGNATCTVSSNGSGKLRCNRVTPDGSDKSVPEAPNDPASDS
ncbi:head GIN domain-containing protein [Tsuneonella flava]|uniref:head GIN domain-containing protein n=1 Tax=Tsuneonella flava TaxID=2055955 RepID=UPI001CC1C4A9|nr:head GIN domain-containing protein [Tsuneonella flava]